MPCREQEAQLSVTIGDVSMKYSNEIFQFFLFSFVKYFNG